MWPDERNDICWEEPCKTETNVYILSIYLQGYGGFSGFMMSMYVVYLLSRNKLNKMMSNYQIMRNVLLHLCK